MTSAQAGCTPGPWTISEARTADDNVMIVGGEGKEFGLIAEVILDRDAETIIRAVNRDAQLAAALEKACALLDETEGYAKSNAASPNNPHDKQTWSAHARNIAAARKALADIGEAKP